jgi:glucose/arabinose dehydrogenase
VFDKNNKLYVTVGDHGQRHTAQDLTTLTGAVLRFNDDGSIPKDNPFINDKKANPAIYTYGNRNPQGIAIEPKTGLIWASEFAPQGGDEINILTAGTNYGWPVITYAEEYGGGKIGETHKEGMAQPVKYWIPSINPSGITFYNGDKFPHWKNNLFIASLNGSILRLTIKDKKVIAEESLTKGYQRIRHVKQGPDGFLYFCNALGGLYRLEPDRLEPASATEKK